MTIRRLSNELFIFMRSEDFHSDYVKALQLSPGTGSITLDSIRCIRTEFGNCLIIVNASAVRTRPQTWQIREHVLRILNRAGLDISISDIQAPGRAKSFRV